MRMLGMNWGSIGTIADAVLATLSRLPFYWPFSWRGISALILGVLLAKWFWVLFAPHATFTAAMPERPAGVEAGRLFGVAVSTEVVTQGVALPNVQLLGVFAASPGKAGFAVLKLDDARQTGVAEGEEITPGTRLLSVHADHVIVGRAAMKQRINMESIAQGGANQGIQHVPSAAAGQINSNKLMEKNIPEHILSRIKNAQQKNQAEIKNPNVTYRTMALEPGEATGNNQNQ